MATDHMAALEKIAKLEDGWHDGQGIAPTKGALKGAKAFIEHGAFYARPDGGVQWEATAGGWEVVVAFNADGSATLIYS